MDKIENWCLAVCCFIVVCSCDNNSDGLILNPIAVHTPLSARVENPVSFDARDGVGFMGKCSWATRNQWTGVLLLSLLQQLDQNNGAGTTTTAAANSFSSSSSLVAANDEKSARVDLEKLSLERDKVERILDANTIQLSKKGIVRLAGVRMPSVGSGGTNSNFQFPTCFTYSPSYKVRQLLPKKTVVRVQTIGGSSSSNGIPQVVLVRNEDSLVVNEELVKTGFAVVKNGFAKQQQSSSSSPSSQLILDAEALVALQENARANGLGIFSKCDADNDGGTIPADSFVAVFEPLERSVETVYFSDGGKQRVRDETTAVSFSKENPPKNPGDVRGCSDFESYEDALQWYEIYQPYYGDVARLDRDGDGVPCPGLPHTTNRERYRMKVPTSSVGIK